MIQYLVPLKKEYSKASNPAKAKQEKAYLKNQFECFGIGSQVRREIQNTFLAEYGLPKYSELDSVIKECWNLPEREFQYFGQELVNKFSKEYERDLIDTLEFMITHKSWWDSVDMIAAILVGKLLLRYPEMIPPYSSKWIESENMWLQRTAILFQLKYKKQTNTKLLSELIIKANKSENKNEFFIRKAIGWTLREYSKTDSKWVTEFINSHDELSNLSKTQGLKWMRNQGIV